MAIVKRKVIVRGLRDALPPASSFMFVITIRSSEPVWLRRETRVRSVLETVFFRIEDATVAVTHRTRVDRITLCGIVREDLSIVSERGDTELNNLNGAGAVLVGFDIDQGTVGRVVADMHRGLCSCAVQFEHEEIILNHDQMRNIEGARGFICTIDV